MDDRILDDRILKKMALDELWALHQRMASILASRLKTQKMSLRIGCAGWVQMVRREKSRLAVDPPRFRQSFAIPLSRTKHGPDEASDRIG
jgi:hypothetical protein